MSKYKLSVLFIFCWFFSFDAWSGYDGKYWVVKRNDTLYAIARSFYPKSARSQLKLRKDIIRLNQNVFANGARGLFIGLKLYLPEYVTSASQTPVKTQTQSKRTKISSGLNLLSDNRWIIKRGDTLYSIARQFFPKSNRKQYHLRKEIISLNPDVFSGGTNKMEVGLALIMPDRLVKKTETKIVMSPVANDVSPVTNTIKENQKVTRNKEVLDDPERYIEDKPETIEPAQKSRKTARSSSDFESKVSLSIGYSLGGDTALVSSGGHDITFGSGAHLRLSYDGLWDNKQGYRIALGYQLDQVTAGSDSGQLKQTYLQSAYLYNLDHSVLGIGLSLHDNIVFETDISAVKTTADFDGAVGMVVLYEYKRFLGDHIIGLSHTSLDSKNSSNQVEVDMSRTEVYYRWRF